MLSRLSLIAAVVAALAYSSPTLAQSTMTPMGHHACKEGGKKGGCMPHHYMGHHACKTGGKKGNCVHHYTGHNASPTGNKK